MAQFVSPQAKELETIISELPVDKVQEVLDFAHYLRLRYVSKPNADQQKLFWKHWQMSAPCNLKQANLIRF